jgi:hypothetical protein|tara:strand:- start:2021 stop:2194 length:174 start_codon:yes stop_codon:yes gene_type:complete
MKRFSAEHWRYYAAQLAKICEYQSAQIKEQQSIILKLIKKRILKEISPENNENENIH